MGANRSQLDAKLPRVKFQISRAALSFKSGMKMEMKMKLKLPS